MLPTTIHHLKSTGGKFCIMIGFILLNPIRFPASNIKSFWTIHSRCPKMLPSLESSSLQKRNVQIKCKCPPTHDTYRMVTGPGSSSGSIHDHKRWSFYTNIRQLTTIHTARSLTIPWPAISHTASQISRGLTIKMVLTTTMQCNACYRWLRTLKYLAVHSFQFV